MTALLLIILEKRFEIRFVCAELVVIVTCAPQLVDNLPFDVEFKWDALQLFVEYFRHYLFLPFAHWTSSQQRTIRRPKVGWLTSSTASLNNNQALELYQVNITMSRSGLRLSLTAMQATSGLGGLGTMPVAWKSHYKAESVLLAQQRNDSLEQTGIATSHHGGAVGSQASQSSISPFIHAFLRCFSFLPPQPHPQLGLCRSHNLN